MSIKKDWMYVSVYNGEYDANEQQFADSLFVAYDYARTLSKPEFLEVEGETSMYVVIRDRAVSTDMEESDYLSAIQDDGESNREL